MYNVCFPLMQLFTVNPRHQGFRTTMIEEFITKLLDILRGTSDRSRPQDAGKHACREKIITIGGLVRSLELPAAIFMLVDYWEQNALHFHRAVRSPSVYGSFDEPHLRHEDHICSGKSLSSNHQTWNMPSHESLLLAPARKDWEPI